MTRVDITPVLRALGGHQVCLLPRGVLWQDRPGARWTAVDIDYLEVAAGCLERQLTTPRTIRDRWAALNALHGYDTAEKAAQMEGWSLGEEKGDAQ